MPQFQTQTTTKNTARMVTLRHPNSFDAMCFRRIFVTETGDNTINGVPVLGGEDTAELDYQPLGMAKVLFVEQWQVSHIIGNGHFADDNRVQILALIESDVEGEFELDKQDIFYIQIKENYGLCYEIIGIEEPIGLPTAMNTKRYVLNKRDELDYFSGVNDE